MQMCTACRIPKDRLDRYTEHRHSPDPTLVGSQLAGQECQLVPSQNSWLKSRGTVVLWRFHDGIVE
jgi:hypothetical protein